MVEVERVFKPTREQLEDLLKNAKHISDFINHDIYYDTPDLKLSSLKIKLRERNGELELKAKIGSGISEEIVDLKEIENYLSITDIDKYIKDELIVIAEFSTQRSRYQKDGILIDIDKTDFDYEICELEIPLSDHVNAMDSLNKIKDFAKKYNIEFEKNIGKKREYFRLFKPEIYKKLYNKDLSSEIKIK